MQAARQGRHGLVLVIVAFCFLVDVASVHSGSFQRVEVRSQQNTSLALHVGRSGLIEPASDGERPVGGRIAEMKRRSHDRIKRSRDRIGSMSFRDSFRKDLARTFDFLMPGKRPSFHLTIASFALLAGFIWAVVYLNIIYTNDRRDLEPGQNRSTPRREFDQDARLKDFKPDVMLIFHHPSHDDTSNHDSISVDNVRSFVVDDDKGDDFMLRTATCLEKADEAAKLARESSWSSIGRHVSRVFTPTNNKSEEEDVEAKEDEAVTVTKGEVREAMLKDCCQSLPKSGFEVSVFSSIDDDEIFVGITVTNKNVLRELLISHGDYIKLQLSPKVIEHLNIGQDPSDPYSSPPYMKYEEQLSRNVLGTDSKGVFKGDDGKQPVDYDTDFYKNSHSKNILGSGTRIELIRKHLQQYFSLDQAVRAGILKDWYPVHSNTFVESLDATWARATFSDVKFLQPINQVNEYFGSRIAFIMAWNGLYCKMLLALIPIALVFEMIARFAPDNSGVVVAFSLILIIWAHISINLWMREQMFFSVLWDQHELDLDREVRPSFRGEKKPSIEDWRKESRQYPRWKSNLRQITAWVILLGFCGIDLACVYAFISGFKGRFDIVASICNAIMIQCFTQIFNRLVLMLSRFENPKYYIDFYNSHLLKIFVFQFINNFSFFFFIAVKMNNTEAGCYNESNSRYVLIHDCVYLLKKQMSSTMFILMFMRVIQLALDSSMVALGLWWEKRQLLKKLEESGGKPEDIPVRGHVEEQAKYGDWGITQQIDGMINLILALGYLLIFGGVAPLVVPLCFFVFVVQLKACAFQSTHCCRRPTPQKAQGLGTWFNIVLFLKSFGVFFSGFLLVQYGDAFEGTQPLTRVSGLFLYMAFTHFLFVLVDLAVPPTSQGAMELKIRRAYVRHKVNRRNTKATLHQCQMQHTKKKNRTAASNCKFTAEVLAGEWGSIPHLIDMQDRAPTQTHEQEP